MKRSILLVLVVGLLIGAERSPKADGKSELEGTWVVVSFTERGKVNDEVKGSKVIFEGDHITVKTKQRDMKATFKADPKKKTIDITPIRNDGKAGKTVKGIYEIKGKELKVCHARQDGARPKEFSGEEGSGNVLIVLQRGKDQ
jgi:uncharacterized protein (TIGR03067 family)